MYAKNDAFGALFVKYCLRLVATALIFVQASPSPAEEVKLNQIQVIGSHNSYHLELHPTIKSVLSKIDPNQENALDYSHRPIEEQLESLKIRSLEFDIYADPEGGHYSQPTTQNIATFMGLPKPPLPPQSIMNQPGFKIIHAPDVDYFGQVFTLKQGLMDTLSWSKKNPHHVPIFILIELKQDYIGPGFTKPVAWTDTLMRDLESEILEIVPRNKIITPGYVRGDFPSLQKAIQEKGWPTLASCRGKFMFCLDNTNPLRDLYMNATSFSGAGRLMFTSVPERHPDAAWFKLNNPVNDFDKIQRLVKDGFIIRTRADSNTIEARTGSTERRNKAITSGAQFISTDYPEPRKAWSDYQVAWPGSQVARPNPISAPHLPSELDLEVLALKVFTSVPYEEVQILYNQGIDLHLQRRVDEASAMYSRVLELHPTACPNETQLSAMKSLMPDFRTVPGEPFSLTDLVVIHHPSKPLIAYHLFWEDDIDFPDDNDPVDHEVVWVRYHPESVSPEMLYSYFHGEIITTPADPNHAYSAFAVEWGKHGSLPFCCPTSNLPDEYERLRSNWNQLHNDGIRRPKSPLARDWPKKFTGSFEEYTHFQSSQPVRTPQTHAVQFHLGEWSNAILDRQALPYNFRPKPDWPE